MESKMGLEQLHYCNAMDTLNNYGTCQMGKIEQFILPIEAYVIALQKQIAELQEVVRRYANENESLKEKVSRRNLQIADLKKEVAQWKEAQRTRI